MKIKFPDNIIASTTNPGVKMLKKKNAKAKPKAKKKVVKKAVRAAKKPLRKPVKKAVKKSVKKGSRSKRAPLDASLEKIGEVTHYFPHVKAAAVKIMKSNLKIGDVIRVKGHTTDFTENVTSIQLDRSPIDVGVKGDEIGLMVKTRVRRGDDVYKIV